jgi:hypothetical protein
MLDIFAIGRVTVRLLQLNRRVRMEDRRLSIQAKVLHVAE